MAAPTASAPSAPDRPRASIAGRTLRTDRWWQAPAISFVILLAFVVYATITAFFNKDYYFAPYLSPFYSPCLVAGCHLSANGVIGARTNVPHLTILGYWWAISPAILILIFPLGFRMTCYYYRRTYYRAFWQSPPACAVSEPHAKYSGETRFPLIVQNIHRYFFYFGLVFNVILTYDAVLAFQGHGANNTPAGWGHVGLGTVVMVINAVLLWAYSFSCHSCRHLVGGRLKHFSRHPIRFKLWGLVSKLNAKHMQLAWGSLIWVALTDLYIRLAASGTLGHGGWI